MKELRAIGIQPDILLCRSDRVPPKTNEDKIALFSHVASEEPSLPPPTPTRSTEFPLFSHEERWMKSFVKKLRLDETAART